MCNLQSDMNILLCIVHHINYYGVLVARHLILVCNWTPLTRYCRLNHFYVHLSCNHLIEDYTEIIYMVEEGDIPSINMSLRVLKSKRNTWSASYRN
jgi:hypothetical protein